MPAVAVTLSLIAHVFLPTGFLRSPMAVDNVQASFFAPDVRIVELDEIERLKESGDCVFVDARMSSAFADFHLPGAINIPIDMGYLRMQRALSEIDKRKTVVMYCQSSMCGWGEVVAQQLAARGVHKIVVYRGGVNEWRAKKTA